MFSKIIKNFKTGLFKKKPFYYGAVLALSISAVGMSSLAHAAPRGVTFKINGKDTTVYEQRPGSAVESYSAVVAKVLFPPSFGLPGHDCINPNQIYTDHVFLTIDIVSYFLFNNRFCADEWDLKTLGESCNSAELEGVHPLNENKKASQNGKVTFTREVYYGKDAGGWDTIRDLEPGWVYYGWGDCWNRRYFDSSVEEVRCDDSTFGGDPKPGVTKMCFYERNGETEEFQMKHFHHT